MPLFEYECDACGKRFELLQKFSDPSTAACACGGTAQRQLSAAAIQFKGSGFYATDYARKSAPAEKSDAKGDTKPESTAKPEEKKPAASPAKDSS
ncbi:MAG TPA: zinc ribbon domain-containing protein [Candidatus Acidoferrales bacterium]|nr:zinc ribbon domain-containing protein [Candidatus Acidoferrales bacterium]